MLGIGPGLTCKPFTSMNNRSPGRETYSNAGTSCPFASDSRQHLDCATAVLTASQRLVSSVLQNTPIPLSDGSKRSLSNRNTSQRFRWVAVGMFCGAAERKQRRTQVHAASRKTVGIAFTISSATYYGTN